MQATDIPTIGNLLVAAGVGAVVIMQRAILSNQKEHGTKLERIDDTVTKIRHWAWGPLGNNGANSKIASLEAEIDDLRGSRGRRASDV